MCFNWVLNSHLGGADLTKRKDVFKSFNGNQKLLLCCSQYRSDCNQWLEFEIGPVADVFEFYAAKLT